MITNECCKVLAIELGIIIFLAIVGIIIKCMQLWNEA